MKVVKAQRSGKSVFRLALVLLASVCLCATGPPVVAWAHVAPQIDAPAISVDNDVDDLALHQLAIQMRRSLPRTAHIGEWGQPALDNALTIVREGCQLGLPPRAYQIALATAMQESDLKNDASKAVPESLNYAHDAVSVDHDSVGLFQQRPSQGWGTVEQIMDPHYAANKFYTELGKYLARHPGWEQPGGIELTVAAQAVQRSAYPSAYAKHEQHAVQLAQALEPYCQP